jgi:lysyl-tRNA synthetase class 2
MLEFYEAYSDAKKQMVFVEKFIKSIVKNILKKNLIKFSGENIDISKKFSTASYFDLIKRHALIIDIDKISKDDIAIKAKQFGIKVEDYESKEKIVDNIFKKIIRPKLIQPTFVTDYPLNYLPLAKKKEDNEEIVDSFQFYIGGLELVKAFSELNDPVDQQERFKQQDKEREAGDKDAQPSDRDFVEAMEYGMPPAGGVGIGIDRLVMLLTDTQNIREVIIFPTLRPK